MPKKPSELFKHPEEQPRTSAEITRRRARQQRAEERGIIYTPPTQQEQ
jgi:hypothetical protein